MFCKNCSKKIDDSAAVCPMCGVATGKPQGNKKRQTKKKNGLVIVEFAVAFAAVLLGIFVILQAV